MAYIIGLCNKEEIKELEARGWEVEALPECSAFKNPKDKYSLRDELQYCMIYVDNDMFAIMSGPDWDVSHLKT